MRVFRCLATALMICMLFASQGCGEIEKFPKTTQSILEKADQWELYPLSPEMQKEKTDESFHGWKVLGKTTVQKEESRKKLLKALQKGIKKDEGIYAKCFNPRHGIRATVDGKTVDLVICFECAQIEIFSKEDGKPEATVLTTDAPQKVFDEVLKEAKVPLPTKK